jgi:hypothetical protein
MTRYRPAAGILSGLWELSYAVVAAVVTVTGDGLLYGANNTIDKLHPLRWLPADVGARTFTVVLLEAREFADSWRHPISNPYALSFQWTPATGLQTSEGSANGVDNLLSPALRLRACVVCDVGVHLAANGPGVAERSLNVRQRRPSCDAQIANVVMKS